MTDGGTTERRSFIPTSGPRACLTVVGCGTLAALAVVGIFIGGLRILDGALSSDSSGESVEAVEGVRQPRESTEPGVVNICAIGIESSGALTGLSRVDDGPDPVDTATVEPPNPDGVRTVEDDCSWELSAPEYGLWTLRLHYTAVMSAEDQETRDRVSLSDFEDKKADAADQFGSIDSQGKFDDDSLDESYYYYGSSIDSSDVSQYVLVGLVGKTSFLIHLQDTESSLSVGESKESDFSQIAYDVAREVQLDVEYHVPS